MNMVRWMDLHLHIPLSVVIVASSSVVVVVLAVVSGSYGQYCIV